MKNNYVDFISDEHMIQCLENLQESYKAAREEITKSKFYSNKIDTFKLTFDAHFSSMSDESIIKAEMLRQNDKSVNNSIGAFHEQILGGVKGFEIGNKSGFDIRAEDDSLFADIKNKHNTMNSSASESLFQKLARYADDHKNAKCYWVQILANKSFTELWSGIINRKEYSHSRVYKISGDQFYALVTGQSDALFQLYKALPQALADLASSNKTNGSSKSNSALDEVKSEAQRSKRKIFDQITADNFGYYFGFDKL